MEQQEVQLWEHVIKKVKKKIQDGGRVGGSYNHLLPGPNWNYN